MLERETPLRTEFYQTCCMYLKNAEGRKTFRLLMYEQTARRESTLARPPVATMVFLTGEG